MKRVNLLIKMCLGLLLVHAAFFADLPQYKDKAIGLRLVFYPLAAGLTYLVSRVILPKRKRPKDYPYVIDLCITFVVAFDLLGNTINYYNSIEAWDDIMHLVLSVPWVLVAGYMIRSQKLPRWVIYCIVLAYGATSHIIWELLEYLTFVRSNPVESLSAYRDTMGDLALSLVGTNIGAWISANFVLKDQ
jgi:hypothetical protein